MAVAESVAVAESEAESVAVAETESWDWIAPNTSSGEHRRPKRIPSSSVALDCAPETAPEGEGRPGRRVSGPNSSAVRRAELGEATAGSACATGPSRRPAPRRRLAVGLAGFLTSAPRVNYRMREAFH